MTIRMAYLAATLSGLLALSAAASGDSRLSITVSPTMAYAPTKLWVYTRVTPDRAHRAIEITAESEEFYRSSEITLDGDRAPRTNVFEFRGLPAGTYEVRGVLKGDGGREIEVATETVTLFETNGRTDR